jgi:putative ABC transport system substrate-binding protein
MRRREFIGFLGSSLAAWPLAARAQQPAMPVIGFLNTQSPGAFSYLVTGFRQGLRETGYVDVTGVIPLISVLGPKRLELLHEMVPKAVVIGMLVNPDFPDANVQSRDLEKAALNLGLQHHILTASSEPEFAIAFAKFRARQIDALLIGNDALFNSRRSQLVALAGRYGIPTIYPLREFAEAGGLMSYGPSLVDAYRQAGIYTPLDNDLLAVWKHG